MSTALVVPTHPNSTSLDIKKLTLSEALKVLEVAIQKHPDLTHDVVSAITAAETRAKSESIRKDYDHIVKEFWNELHREDGWSNYDKQFGGMDLCLLEELIAKVVKSVNESSEDEIFENAYRCFLILLNDTIEVKDNVDDDDIFPPDLSDAISAARDAMGEITSLWMTGAANRDDFIAARIQKLVDEVNSSENRLLDKAAKEASKEADEDDYDDYVNYTGRRWGSVDTDEDTDEGTDEETDEEDYEDYYD
jgi:hypothetical protein